MAEPFSLKDQLFNAETVAVLAAGFEKAGVFDGARFVARVVERLPVLELKQRIAMIAEELAKELPQDFPDAAAAILASLPPPLDPNLRDDDFGQFIYAPLGVFVETQGLEHHRDLSLDLLEALTQRFSMEFSIRAFLTRWPDATLERMQDWSQHSHYHVRRLVSEGTRPRLPWAARVDLPLDQTLPLLDRLHADPTRFVTRSVANHLNDISKAQPDVVLDRLEHWVFQNAQDTKELDWMRKHALRGLIKAGHPATMLHLGYRPDAEVTVKDVAFAPTALLRGQRLTIDAELVAQTKTPVIVDYVIDFMKNNGESSPKVFKWKVAQLGAGKPLRLTKTHHFKNDATTFRLYPGRHVLHIQVNGRRVWSGDFMLG